MKKLIFSFSFLAFLATFSFAQTTITDGGSGNIELSATGDANGSNLFVKTTSGAGRTQLIVRPTNGDDRAFINVATADDPNRGIARLGARDKFAILSGTTANNPAVRLTSVAIELDPKNIETGEAFVVGSGAFFGSGAPTMLAKVDAAGLSTIEAKVQATVAPPDYVFKADYNLRSLEEVEAYINEHSHLPEIPSAAEFEAEGIKLGLMSFDLLKKVEELTLYMIDMKKENDALKARVVELENKKK